MGNDCITEKLQGRSMCIGRLVRTTRTTRTTTTTTRGGGYNRNRYNIRHKAIIILKSNAVIIIVDPGSVVKLDLDLGVDMDLVFYSLLSRRGGRRGRRKFLGIFRRRVNEGWNRIYLLHFLFDTGGRRLEHIQKEKANVRRTRTRTAKHRVCRKQGRGRGNLSFHIEQEGTRKHTMEHTSLHNITPHHNLIVSRDKRNTKTLHRPILVDDSHVVAYKSNEKQQYYNTGYIR